MTAPLHWREYLMEVAGLGLFMVSAATMTALLEHPASPARALVPDPTMRRAAMGLAMGLTAAALIYSPWGRRSGAHNNPAVPLTFFRLGQISGRRHRPGRSAAASVDRAPVGELRRDDARPGWRSTRLRR